MKILLPALSALLLLTACSGGASPTPLASLDPCLPENLAAATRPVNDLMREFDDGARLATVVQIEQLVYVVPDLQQVHRRAEDLAVPGCLGELHRLELEYMEAVIDTLLVFIQMRETSAGPVQEGVRHAQDLHALYNQELARLGGEVLPTEPAPSATP